MIFAYLKKAVRGVVRRFFGSHMLLSRGKEQRYSNWHTEQPETVSVFYGFRALLAAKR